MTYQFAYYIKYILIFSSLLIFPLNKASAQEKESKTFSFFKPAIQKADTLFKNGNYKSAIEEYKNVLQKDKKKDYCRLKIAIAYFHNNEPEYAVAWFKKIINNEELIEKKHIYWYAQCLKSVKSYNEAISWYKKYEKLVPKDNRPENHIEVIKNIKLLRADANNFRVLPVRINSERKDFSPVITGSGADRKLIFLSNRQDGWFLQKIFKGNKKDFYDIYISDINKATDLKPPVEFSEDLNADYNQGPVALYSNNKKIIFTVNTSSNDKKRHLQLYSAELRKDKWTNIKPLSVNKRHFSTGHPSLSKDENTLYFFSDNPDGYGGADIYKSKWKGGKWGEPENLGDKINTKGDELYPRTFGENYLIFSSNGHGSIGGLDLFKVRITKNRVGPVKNMGIPLNSSFDDFGLSLYMNGHAGYFSSNRKTKNDNDDIFFISMKVSPKQKFITIIGDVFLKKYGKKTTITPIKTGEAILVHNHRDQIIGSIPFSKNKSSFTYELKPDIEYNLKIKNKKYGTIRDTFLFSEPIKEDTIKKMYYYEKKPFNFKGTVLHQKDSTPVNEATVYYYDTTANKLDSVYTNKKGAFKLSLKPSSFYVIKATKRNYFDDCYRLNTLKNLKGLSKAENPLYLQKITMNQNMAIPNVYYKYDSWHLKKSTTNGLDKILNLMKEIPEIKIILSAHTDVRGTKEYNLSLSKKRAKAAKKYITKKGIAPSRIKTKGYGESRLTNDCNKPEKCTDAKHAKNRRTEIKVINRNKDELKLKQNKYFNKNEDHKQCKTYIIGNK